MRRRDLACHGRFPAVAGRRGGHPEPMGDSRRRRAGARLYRLGLRLEHVQPSDSGAAARRTLVVQPAVYDFHHGARAARPERRVRRSVGGTARTARGRDGRGAVLRHRAPHRRHRAGAAPVAARLSRDGRHQRHRLRARLHLAGQHAREVVPGPPRHGHRHGHHGLRRRRLHRRLPERVPDGPRGCGLYGDVAGRRLPGRDARRVAAAAAAAGGLAAGGLDRAGRPRRP